MNEYVEMPDGDLVRASYLFDLLECATLLHAYLMVNAPSYMQDSARYQQLMAEYDRAVDKVHYARMSSV